MTETPNNRSLSQDITWCKGRMHKSLEVMRFLVPQANDVFRFTRSLIRFRLRSGSFSGTRKFRFNFSSSRRSLLTNRIAQWLIPRLFRFRQRENSESNNRFIPTLIFVHKLWIILYNLIRLIFSIYEYLEFKLSIYRGWHIRDDHEMVEFVTLESS